MLTLFFKSDLLTHDHAVLWIKAYKVGCQKTIARLIYHLVN
jgi:hypothetical protein